jgi:argininosuccinate lyase
VDFGLLRFDVAGSVAHARGLAATGIITAGQLRFIERGLREVLEEMEGGEAPAGAEDVHSVVEQRLTEITPEGARLHAGRSRNDQVALDLRLYCRAACAEITGRLALLATTLAEQARRHAAWLMPGYTHLQRAQPVTAGQHLLAHAQPLLRDLARFRQAYDAADVLPLGAGALAGSTLPLQRQVVARELGFSRLSANTMDAVSDRDFALDLVYACTVLGVHLSRLGEDLVLWASAEFGFLQLADEIATGSSLMPQKKNPDVAELLRGRSGRPLGGLVTLATVLKGLPLTYDRDLQEDKAVVFGAVENAAQCLLAAKLVVERIRFDRERLAAAAADPDLLATDSAESLVSGGVPFREAHRRVGEQVRQGAHVPPWDAARSVELRRLDVAGQVREVKREAAAAQRWARSHPPPLPL